MYLFFNRLHWATFFLATALLLLSFVPKVDSFDSFLAAYPSWKQVVDWFASNLKLLTVVSGGICALAKVIAQQIGPGWMWESIHGVLNQLRDEFLEDEFVNDPEHYHRVTLFQYVSWTTVWFLFTPKMWLKAWRWQTYKNWPRIYGPWSGWLVVVCRSGHFGKNTSDLFLACDHHFAGSNEGIAGKAFRDNKPVDFKFEHDINAPSPSQEHIEEYAKKANVSTKWVANRFEKNKQVSLMMYGVPIEVNNKPWGVIVIDSRNANGQITDATILSFGVSFIGKLLKGAGS